MAYYEMIVGVCFSGSKTEDDVKKNNPSNMWVFALACMVLAACGGEAVVTEPPTTAPKVTASGFLCPPPEFPAVVTSTELHLFTWTEYIPSEMMDCFEMVYGIKIFHDQYSSDEEMYDGVSGGGSRYDLFIPSDYIVALAVDDGLLQELDHTRLPALKNLDPNYLDFEFDPGNRYTVPYLIGADAIVVNTAAVESIPQSWADLWKPEYAGRIVFLDDSRAAIGLTLLTLGYDPNSTDPAQLEEARLKLLELVPRIKLFDSDSPKTALLAGAVDLGMTWTGEAFIAQQGNPNIEFIYPSEGAILWQDNWAILANAAHVDAAYAWLNYANQGNVAWMTLRDFPYTNPNRAALDFAKGNQMKTVDVDGREVTLADLYNAYMESPITNIPLASVRNGHRIADVGEALDLYERIWDEVRNGH